MTAYARALVLVSLGCLQMAGDLSGSSFVKALGLALQVSPAPKVFTAQQGFETYSSRFYLDWTDRAGDVHTYEVTRQAYRGLHGPYNRRNAYGAAISYAPVLAADPRTRPLVESVARFAFCGDAPLLRELGIPNDRSNGSLRVRLEPRDAASRAPRWQQAFPVSCPDAVTP